MGGEQVPQQRKESKKTIPEVKFTDDELWEESTKASQTCFHHANAQKYGKVWPSLKIQSLQGNEERDGCVLCYANGFRTGISEAFLRYNHSGPSEIAGAVSGLSFKAGLATGREGSAESETIFKPWTWPIADEYAKLTSDYKSYVFKIEARQYGEMFHILFAKLFSPNIKVVNNDFIEDETGKDKLGKVNTGKGTTGKVNTGKGTTGKGTTGKGNTGKDNTGKDEGTKDETGKDKIGKKRGDIFPTFEYYGAQSKPGEQQEDKSIPESNFTAKDLSTPIIGDAFARANDQETLFRALRATLERQYIPRDSAVAPKTLDYYCGVSYLGKFWINRFLTLTKQGEHKVNKERWRLPKEKDVQRMALIYIRREGLEGSIGRSMTLKNANVCLEAIAHANVAAKSNKPSSPIFTHILFFGDFETRREATDLQNLVSDIPGLKDDVPQNQVLYITKPWMSPAKPNDFTDFWAEYQAQGSNKPGEPGSYLKTISEGAPLQIKNMAMFLALQARYQKKICAIGFRGGYLDLAGFIGVPTFFVAEAWTEGDLKKLIYQKAGNDGRMVAVCNQINTFIRIDFPRPRSTRAAGELEELWDMSGNEDVRQRLAAALYVFMLAKLKVEGPLWTRRVSLLENDGDNGPLKNLVEGFLSVKKG